MFSCFSAGVFLATSLLDIIPKYLTEMKSTFNDLGVTVRFPTVHYFTNVHPHHECVKKSGAPSTDRILHHAMLALEKYDV